MTRTESIGRSLRHELISEFVVFVFVFSIIGLLTVVIGTAIERIEDRREMSAIANDSANRKAHERTTANIAKKGVMPNATERQRFNGVVHKSNATAPVTNSPAKVGNVTGANTGGRSIKGMQQPKAADSRSVRSRSLPPLRQIQEDAWKSTALAPANRRAPQKFSSSAESAATADSIAEATPNRPHAVQHPTNPRPTDLSGLPMYRLIADSASWYQMVPDGAAEAEDITTTVTFRRNDPRNKVDLTHPISICVEYPDAADHVRSCGSANWMAPDTNDLTIDVVMPRRNTSGEPYARFGQNITCNVTYYDETNGAHMVMTTEQWSGGDCGAVAMIVVGGRP